MKDFFVSYNKADKQWAEWIAWTLEEAGYSALIQAWDFRPGANFVLEMQKAAQQTQRTLAVLSEDYLNAEFTQPEWAAAFAQDPQGKDRKLVPVRVRKCSPEGLLGPVVYVDLVGLGEQEACDILLQAFLDRAKPAQPPGFPGGRADKASDQPPPAVLFPGKPWNVPIPPNAFFTGREKALKDIDAAFNAGKAAALCGLGGVGKTQTAARYAYLHRDEYKAVLWVNAATRENLVSGFVALAALLNLPEAGAQDQAVAVGAVKRWMEANSDWLLILDNANELPVPREFGLPAPKGRLLLTTQAPALGGLARRVEIEEMEPKEGATFLLRRALLLGENDPLELATESDRKLAQQISQELGGLPLALDQGGAYLEETGCGLERYLDLYRRHGAELRKLRGRIAPDHASVAATFALSFEKVKQASEPASEILRLCAFLDPDAIPEEILTEGAPDLGPILAPVAADPLKLDTALSAALRYSLLRRRDGTLSVHRLVQQVIRDGMSGEDRRQWAERAVRAVDRAFPPVEFVNWGQCERLLPQAQACAELIKEFAFEFAEAGLLLNQAAIYLYHRARYAEAEALYQRSLAIREKALGPDHPDVAASLNNLAVLYKSQGRYAQAEPLHKRSLAIREQALGPDHPDLATSLNNLAGLHFSQGEYAQAKPLYKRSLAIMEKNLGADHPDVATSLNNLAELYRHQGKYAQAEPLYQRSLAIRGKALGPDHPDLATSLNNLAGLHFSQGEYAQAKPLYKRSLAIMEKNLGADHPDVATSLNNLALLYHKQGKYAQAEPLYQRSLAILEKVLGPDHPNVAAGLDNLASLNDRQGKYAEAEPLFQRALGIRENVLGPDHPGVATSLNNLAVLYDHQGKYAQAEPLLQRALAIMEKNLGADHPDVANVLGNYAALLRKTGRESEAVPMEARAKGIRARHASQERS